MLLLFVVFVVLVLFVVFVLLLMLLLEYGEFLPRLKIRFGLKGGDSVDKVDFVAIAAIIVLVDGRKIRRLPPQLSVLVSSQWWNARSSLWRRLRRFPRNVKTHRKYRYVIVYIP